MALRQVLVGSNPNDGTGDSIRDAFIKCNENFSNLDVTLGANASFVQLSVTNGISGGIITSPIYKSTNYIQNDNSVTIQNTSATVIDSWSALSYRSCKYNIEISDGTNSGFYEILVVHNTASVSHSIFGNVVIGSIGSFSTSISSGVVNLTFTAATATNKVIKTTRTLINT